MQPTAQLARVAQAKHGIFHLGDVTEVGLTIGRIRTLVDQGWCEAVSDGVYRVVGAPSTWEQAMAAAVAVHRGGAVVTHQAAARLWGVPGYRDAGPTVSVAIGRNRRNPLATVRTSLWLPDEHLVVRDGLPVTTIARTLFDLAGVESFGRLERAVDHVLAGRGATLPQLERVHFALAGPGRRGTVAFRRILEERGDGVAVPASELERVARRLFAEAGLPAPAYEVDLGASAWVGRVDCLWRDACLVVELDGRRHHSAKRDRDRDRRRDNQLMAQGWRVLRFTWDDLHQRPAEVVALIRRALARPTSPT